MPYSFNIGDYVSFHGRTGTIIGLSSVGSTIEAARIRWDIDQQLDYIYVKELRLIRSKEAQLMDKIRHMHARQIFYQRYKHRLPQWKKELDGCELSKKSITASARYGVVMCSPI